MTFAWALHPHRAAMKLDQVFCNRKTKSKPRMRSRRGTVSLAKPLEHIRQELGLDTDPAVSHVDLEVRIDPF